MKTKLLALLGANRRAFALVFVVLAVLTLAAFQAPPGLTRGLAETLFWKKDGSAQTGSLNIQAATNAQASLVVKRKSSSQTPDVFLVELEDGTDIFKVASSSRTTVSGIFSVDQRLALASTNVTSGGTIAAGSGVYIRYTSTNSGGTLNLPTSPLDNQLLIIRDAGGAAGTNPITLVAGVSPLNIEGASTYSLNVSGGCWGFRYRSGGTWDLVFSPAVATVAQAAENVHRFYQLTTAQKNPTLSNSGGILNIVFFGDSWTYDGYYVNTLRTALRAKYGNGGAGWMSWIHNTNPPDGVTLSVTGSWTAVDGSSSAAALGADGAHMVSTAAGNTAKVDNSDDSSIEIHYGRQVGGGTFRWRLNAGAWTTVDTSHTSTAFGSVLVTGLDGTDDDVEIEVVTQGTNGVILMGAVGRRTSGVICHRVGNGGLTAEDAAGWNWTVVGAGIANLQPDCITVLLGSNESNEDKTPASYAQYMGTVVDNFTTATATLHFRPDIGLIFPSDNGRVAVYTMAQYEASFITVARLKNCPSLSLLKTRGTYNSDATYGWVATGLYYNNIHPAQPMGDLQAADIQFFWPPFGINLLLSAREDDHLWIPAAATLNGPGFAA